VVRGRKTRRHVLAATREKNTYPLYQQGNADEGVLWEEVEARSHFFRCWQDENAFVRGSRLNGTRLPGGSRESIIGWIEVRREEARARGKAARAARGRSEISANEDPERGMTANDNLLGLSGKCRGRF